MEFTLDIRNNLASLSLDMLLNVVKQEKMLPRNYENHTVQKRLLGEFYKEDVTLPVVENRGTSAYEETIDMKLFGYLEILRLLTNGDKKKSCGTLCTLALQVLARRIRFKNIHCQVLSCTLPLQIWSLKLITTC